ncbi:Putative peroxiredoxin [Thalassovita gelatinovora]|uniref:Glutathione-dependent peroxiredoxin n=1 Tax=Thalassovita gelatinovora TaxID=53501 RepID=A0A0N7LUD2_THAGE|nr:peroxiredoxin [Thalassovita gelatinovora]QIZ80788.1 peroxiredoxin [Thalassovita gelatinovora]CUH63170.1 Putative peroxiredoxin [Thalassovita gelatinovora]SEQ62893.1 thiol peroxidase (atypical 2-Cys peroxiredoxin) [Thalassovita gelatinovora]
MTISIGDHLPEASFIRMGAEGPETVSLEDKVKGRKVAIFAVPAAFSTTCQTAHMPSFIRNKDRFAEKGVEEIICIAVNDPFVMTEWAKATGANEAGITMLADPDGAYTRAIGMTFDAPVVGLYGRSKRYAMLVEDGKVTVFQPELTRGCETSSGEALLAEM